MNEFYLEVNGIEVKVVENGFDEDLYTAGPGISITATTPDGKEQDYWWWYEDKGKGAYTFDDGDHDGHVALLQWLQEQTGCDDDEAIEAIEIILDNIDASDKYADTDLYNTYMRDDTKIYIGSGIMLSSRSGDIYKTKGGEYIGIITHENDIETITKVTEEEVKALEAEIEGLQYDDGHRTELIIEAIEEAAERGNK